MKNISKIFALNLLAGLSLSILACPDLSYWSSDSWPSKKEVLKFIQKPEIEKLLKLVHSFGTPELIRNFEYSEKAEACIQAFLDKHKKNMSSDDLDLFEVLFKEVVMNINMVEVSESIKAERLAKAQQ